LRIRFLREHTNKEVLNIKELLENHKKLEKAITIADTSIQQALFAINSIETQKVKMLIPNQRLLANVFNNLTTNISILQMIRDDERASFENEKALEEE
jgi:hypothetical protein